MNFQFYFSNHNSMFADKDDIELMPDHFALDFELEFAAIGKGKTFYPKMPINILPDFAY